MRRYIRTELDFQLRFLLSAGCLADLHSWNRLFEWACMVHCDTCLAVARVPTVSGASGGTLPLTIYASLYLEVSRFVAAEPATLDDGLGLLTA